METCGTKVIIMPADVKLEDCRIVWLPHPKTFTPVRYLHHPTSSRLFELLQMGHDASSWFVNDAVVSDGHLLVAAPFDLRYLLLACVCEKARRCYVDVDELLSHVEVEAERRLLAEMVTEDMFDCFCETKTVNDSRMYRLEIQRCLEWLGSRHAKVMKQLQKDETSSVNICESADLLKRYAYGLLSDYLPTSVAVELKKHLQVVEAETAAAEPTKKKRKLSQLNEAQPDEDYYNKADDSNKQKADAKLTLSQKQLQKASSGTKSIMSFFGGNKKK